MPDPERVLDFDPSVATIVRTPPGEGYGNWVGGKVSFDPESGVFTLFTRERKPLEQGRAGRCAVSVSTDGVDFEEVWSASKEFCIGGRGAATCRTRSRDHQRGGSTFWKPRRLPTSKFRVDEPFCHLMSSEFRGSRTRS